MAIFYFNLRDGGAGVADDEGTELPNLEAAKAYAADVARELIKCREAQKRDWRLDVRDSDERLLFRLPFASVDPTLDHLKLDQRDTVERLCETKLTIKETLFNSRALVQYIRAIKARSRQKPYLAASFGRRMDIPPPLRVTQSGPG